MKTITDVISKKQMYVLALAPHITVWFTLFCIIMIAVWYLSKSALIGFGSAIAIPAFLIKWGVDRKILVINKLLDDVRAKSLASLQNIDYFYYNANGSISVDSRAAKISYIKVLPTLEVLSPVIVNVADVVEFYFYDPGMTTTKYYGRDMAVAQEVLADNLKAIGARAEARGVHIKLDDLQHPKIVMNMTAKEADHWTVILRKLMDGSLDPTNAPKLIP
ncbi:hypothetical protein [Pseudomonas allokribbensis]|uniref:hypothetical protein n=1 Tax=Pseudomonas allokribbensis TaxID=2774460 RepID=UPI00178808BF|nr:hypothetical protein [Pseudomonas allokribbensis]